MKSIYWIILFWIASWQPAWSFGVNDTIPVTDILSNVETNTSRWPQQWFRFTDVNGSRYCAMVDIGQRAADWPQSEDKWISLIVHIIEVGRRHPGELRPITQNEKDWCLGTWPQP